jgi:hypothetical protein
MREDTPLAWRHDITDDAFNWVACRFAAIAPLRASLRQRPRHCYGKGMLAGPPIIHIAA